MIKEFYLNLFAAAFAFTIALSLLASAENGTENGTGIAINGSNDISNYDISAGNLTVNATKNESVSLPNESQQQYIDFNVTSFVPKELKVGDVQFNIQIKNTGNVELKNIVGIVSGRGFSAYDILPLESLKPGEKHYMSVIGNLKEEGNITLSIKINDKTFYQDIVVTDPSSRDKAENLKKLKEEEEKISSAISALSAKLEELKASYGKLEEEYNKKKNSNYDVSEVKIEDDLKQFIQNAESSVITKDVEQANISITLGFEEYLLQKEKLNKAKAIKKSTIEVVKNNLLLFSTIAASIITLFSFYEIMKKKKEAVSQQFTDKIGLIRKNAKKDDKETIENGKQEEKPADTKPDEDKKEEVEDKKEEVEKTDESVKKDAPKEAKEEQKLI